MQIELFNKHGYPTIRNGGILPPTNVNDVRTARQLVDKIRGFRNGSHEEAKGVKHTKFNGESIITALENAETELINVLQRNQVFLSELGCMLVNAGIEAGGMDLTKKLRHGYDVYLSEGQRKAVSDGLKLFDEFVETTGQASTRTSLDGFGTNAKITRVRADIVLDGTTPMVDVSSNQRGTLEDWADNFSPLSAEFREHCKDIPSLQAVPLKELAKAS